MWAVKPKTRFSLLLLDEGEYYFDDFSAVYYPDLEDEQAVRRKVKGRLKLCSASLLFDPEDTRLPIIKFPFSQMAYIEPYPKTGPLHRYLPEGTQVFVLCTRLLVEMKENNENKPYVFRKMTTTHRFSLSFESLDTFLPRVQELRTMHADEGVSGRLVAQANLRKYIERREKNTQFDRTWIVDLEEVRLAEMSALRVTPLVANPGRFLLTHQRLYFQPLNNVDANPVEKYLLANITHISKRRHSLRQVALEIFFTEGNSNNYSAYFSFRSQEERDKIYDLLMRQECVRENVKHTSLHEMRLRWQYYQISNFEYLLYLNHEADRSFQDLTQYPVFPWVIADYTSPVLDLSSPQTFRDLSKPIGALNPTRLKTFKERYQQMLEAKTDVPPFLYGTHYSTPGYVLFYLVRVAPEYMLRLQNGKFDAPDRMFHSISETWQNVLNNPSDVKELIPEFYMLPGDFLRNLQGLNLGVRSNGEKLGDVILPPWAKPQDANDFVSQCRAALESDHVSENLHHWIDLIFGYKQRGEEAVKDRSVSVPVGVYPRSHNADDLQADNVFYHLTYEGNIDIESVKDPVQRAAIETQINEFGQTPKQLFTSPHPRRAPKGTPMPPFSPSSTPPLEDLVGIPAMPKSPLQPRAAAPLSTTERSDSFSPTPVIPLSLDFDLISPHVQPLVLSPRESENLSSLTDLLSSATISSNATNSTASVPVPQSLSPSPAAALALPSHLSTLACKSRLRLHRDMVMGMCLSVKDPTILYSVSQDTTLKIFSLPEGRQIRSINLCELTLSSCILSPDEKSILVASWDNNVYLYSVDYGRVLDTLSAHDDAVSCLAMKEDRVASGSWDSTIKVWQFRPTGISKVPLLDFVDHETEVKSLDISPDLRYVVSGGGDGSVMIGDLRASRSIRSYSAHKDSVNAVRFTPDGKNVISCSSDGCVKILEASTGSQLLYANSGEKLNCMVCDANFVILGGDKGSLRIWDLEKGMERRVLHDGQDSITSITATPSLSSIVTGSADGSVKWWTPTL